MDRILASTKEELLLALKDTEMVGNAVSPGNCHVEGAGSQIEEPHSQIEEPLREAPIEPASSGTNDEAAASSGSASSESHGAQQNQQAHLQLQEMADSRGPVCTSKEAANLVSVTDDLLSMTDDFLVLADSLECEDSASFFSLQDELLHAAAVYEENEKHGAPFLSQTGPGSGTTGAANVPADGGSEAEPHAPMDSDWPQIDVNADSTVADHTLHHDEEPKSETFTPPMVTNPIYLYRYSGDDSQGGHHRASSVDTSIQLKTSFDQHMSPALTAEPVQKWAAPVAADQSQSAVGDAGIDTVIHRTGLELAGTARKAHSRRNIAESTTTTSRPLSSSLSSVGLESILMAAQLREERLSLEKAAAETNAASRKSASAPLDLPAAPMEAALTENHEEHLNLENAASETKNSSSHKSASALLDLPASPMAAAVTENHEERWSLGKSATETNNLATHRSASAPLDLPAAPMAAAVTENHDGNGKVLPLAGPEAHISRKDDAAIQSTTGNTTADRIIDRINALLGKRRPTDEDSSISSRGSSPFATDDQELKDNSSVCERTTNLSRSPQGRLSHTTSHQATDATTTLDHGSSVKTSGESTQDHPHKGLSVGSGDSLQINVHHAPSYSTSCQPEPAGETDTILAGWTDTEGDSGRDSGSEIFSLRDGVVLSSEETRKAALGPLETLASVPMYTEQEDLPLSHWETDNLQLSSAWMAKQHAGSHQESSAVSETLGKRQTSFEESGPLKASETPWEVDSQVLNDTSIVSKASVSTGDGALRWLLELASHREESLDMPSAAIAPDDEDHLLLSPKPRDHTAGSFAHVRELCMLKLNRYEDILDAAEADESYDLDDMLSGAGMGVTGKTEELSQDLFGLLQSPSDHSDPGHPTPVSPIPSGRESPQVCQHRCLSPLLPFSSFQIDVAGLLLLVRAAKHGRCRFLTYGMLANGHTCITEWKDPQGLVWQQPRKHYVRKT